ncbi:MAG: TipAS antibiotic-recognition domain-containing protein, partial [Pseudomonadota bacterium]
LFAETFRQIELGVVERPSDLVKREAQRSPDEDLAESLRKQRALLSERAKETEKMIASIDKTFETLEGGGSSATDLEKIFDGFNPEAFAAETKARWSETDAYQTSARRTAKYSETEWRALKGEADGIWAEAASAMATGEPADGEAAGKVVERHRLHICRWFYELSPEAHAKLADLWQADERFSRAIDEHGPGLTEWLAAAVRAAANR